MKKKNLAPIIVVPLCIGLIFLILTNKPNSSVTKESLENAALEQEKVVQEIEKQVQSENMPEMQIDQTKKYSAVLKTSKGDITVELTADKTPITVNNFVTLANKDFYTDTIFHRVIKDFMIQGGDPTGSGAGGPGYRFDDEPFEGEYTRGTVAMANAGPNTNGSQFFIMHKDNALPKNYVIFGKVVDGFDALDAIAETEVTRNSTGELSSPTEEIKLLSVTIIEE